MKENIALTLLAQSSDRLFKGFGEHLNAGVYY